MHSLPKLLLNIFLQNALIFAPLQKLYKTDSIKHLINDINVEIIFLEKNKLACKNINNSYKNNAKI